MGILFELLNDTEKLACNFYYSTVSGEERSPSWNKRATAHPRPHAKLPSATPTLPSMRPYLDAGT
jgi:hypothetical protein